MSNFPHLETSRLHLREITEADAPALLRIHGDTRHMALFGTDALTSLDDAKKVVATFASWMQLPNPGIRWGLELRERPGLIGTCGLFAWNRHWRKCATGYEIAPEHVRMGLMAEALRAAFAWGFDHMALNRIEAQVHEDNQPSVNLLTRLGFQREGRLREVAFWSGRHHDLLQYSLLASDWLRASGAGQQRTPRVER